MFVVPCQHNSTSLPASLLAWLLIPMAEDSSQNNPSCYTHARTHTHSCLSPVSSPGEAAVVVHVSTPSPASGPAPAKLYVCAESCWEDGVSLDTEGASIFGWVGTLNKLSSTADRGWSPCALKKQQKGGTFKIYREFLIANLDHFHIFASVQQNIYI